jgi:hypothetical protein
MNLMFLKNGVNQKTKMTEEKEKTEAEKREKTRELQLGLLMSSAAKDLYIASSGKDVAKYGDAGKQATQMLNYVRGLSNADGYVGKMTASPFLEAAINAQKNGRDVYEEGAVTPLQLLKNARGYYMSAIDKVKVSDVLALMDIKEIHEKNISKEEKEMYMEDFKAKNEEMYSTLISTYFNSVENEGVGEAIKNFGAMQRKSLETILKEAPIKKDSAA